MADARVEIYWADDRERADALKLVADAGGRVVAEQQGRLVAHIPDYKRSVCEATHLPCHFAPVPTLDPGVSFDVPTPAPPSAAAREVFRLSQHVVGGLWNQLQQHLDPLDDPAARRTGDAGLLDEDTYVVTLAGPLKPQWRKLLETFGRVTPFTDPSTVVVRLRKAEVAAVRRLTDLVTGVRRYCPDDSMTPAMTAFLDTTAKAHPDRPQRFDVLLHDAADRAAFEAFVGEQADLTVLKRGASAPSYRVEAPAGSPVVAAVARLPQVRTITPFQPGALQMDAAARLIGCRVVGTAATPEWTGAGQLVAVFDSGIDATHPDLAGALAAPPAQYGEGRADDADGHGTHVAGIIAGRGAVIRGVAPGCQLLSCGITDPDGVPDVPNPIGELFEAAVQAGAKIINLSWRAGIAPEYNVYGAGLDDFVRRHPDVLVVVAAGNQGKVMSRDNDPRYLCAPQTIGNPASAKNVLTVGACPNDRPAYTDTYSALNFPNPPFATRRVTAEPFTPAPFSCRGPTSLKSAKPDLLAPGTVVASLRARGATAGFVAAPLPTDPATGAPVSAAHYAYLSGTSMAAPMVAGAAAVVREYLAAVHALPAPSAALVKALLLLATAPVAGASADSLLNDPRVGAPDYDQGHGRLDLRELLPHPGGPARVVRCFDVPNDSPQALESEVEMNSARPAQATYRLTVPAASNVPLRLALVWTDVPAPGVYNHLSLRVRLPNDRYTYGNDTHRFYADPAKVLVGRQVLDEQNNVLCVRVDNPPAGDYLVVVTAVSTPSPPQGYALAVTGPL